MTSLVCSPTVPQEKFSILVMSTKLQRWEESGQKTQFTFYNTLLTGNETAGPFYVDIMYGIDNYDNYSTSGYKHIKFAVVLD